MASKAVIIAGLVLLVAAACYAEESEGEKELVRSKRGPIGWIIAGLGEGLKLFLDGLNKGVKGLLTGATYFALGFWAGCSNGLQLWRLGAYRALHGVVDIALNLINSILLSPTYTNFFGANHP